MEFYSDWFLAETAKTSGANTGGNLKITPGPAAVVLGALGLGIVARLRRRLSA